MGSLGLIIPILIFSIPIIAIWTSHQQKMAKLRLEQPEAGSGQAADSQAEQIRALEDRVRVLERIVTDGGYCVAAQIEALRDQPDLPGNGVPLGLEKERL